MIDIKDMFACGVHYGHRSCFSNPKMAEYVFAEKNGMQIIDITQSAEMFTEALTYVDQIVRSGGRVVIVSTKQSAQALVQKHGEEMGMPFVDQRWLGGTLTNFKTVRSSVARLEQLEERFQSGRLEGLTKKERLILQRERAKLTVNLGGIKDLDSLPEALFVIDVAQERIAVNEANKLGIPVIGIVDTNCSPNGINYVVPGNDDAMSAIQYYLECLSSVVKAAADDFRKEREKIEAKNKPVIKKKQEAKKVVAEKSEQEEPESSSAKKVVKKVVKKAAEAQVVSEEPKKKVVKKVVKAKAEGAEAPKKAVKKPAAKKPAAKKPAAKESAKKSTEE
ncbi:30S ribosomal protein S2 [Candidatus Synchoanobacter obligatus]|uniref:Small ribosomal subunit protein uS2 n=1 Tax=Candidatus Synchoanobacter obligatus TaxID=2919597 RepID=A0ABT1L5A4_9GAMM|nr:30S ribosomal protein S2 [Candidatus Synchoanobacter obligatus]MCP8352096.1 30S ribosomal protein S2 [Candidatus Synchoanobacter obligatus]